MRRPLTLLLAFFGLSSAKSITIKTNNTDQPICTSSWEIVASPKIIVPGQESVVFVAPKNDCNNSQTSADDLMATLTIWDTTHHKIIHGMVWQVQQATTLDKPKNKDDVIGVEVRVPSNLSKSRGILRLHSKTFCHPFENQTDVDDEKCPKKCGSSCLEIPFRLGSTTRQILLISDKTVYTKGETVRIRYQVLDESTNPANSAELTITLGDPGKNLMHTWNLGFLQRSVKASLFEEITFPLGPRSSEGKWIICAALQQGSIIIIDENEQQKYCINFFVKSQQPNNDYDKTIVSQKHSFQMQILVATTFRPNVPISGKILSLAKSEDEVEVLVKLLEGSTLLDQQTLVISPEEKEAIFNFPAKNIQNYNTNNKQAKNYSIEAYLVFSNINNQEEEAELEIDEVTAENDKAEESNFKTNSIFLASADLTREPEMPARSFCPIWIQGLERSFKTGDFATVNVKAACGCQNDLNWVMMRGQQFVAWGQQRPQQQQQQQSEGQNCFYKVGLEITSRMAPFAIFKAWRPIYYGDSGGLIYTYDEQNVTVNLEDRTLVILELNTTEVSHSTSTLGIEVFAEPESTICLRGKKVDDNIAPEEESDEEEMSNTLSQDTMIKVFQPTSKTWFFQCGNASEDGFYSTNVKCPDEGGQWSVEAVSLSPFHGLRMAQPQPLLRTLPITVQILGIPTSVKRGEILSNVTIVARNNMPINLQLTAIVTASTGILFEENFFFESFQQQNVSGYATISKQFKIRAKELGPKVISAHVTAVAFVDSRFVEVDSVHIRKELNILPRGRKVVHSQLDYFCTSKTDSKMDFQGQGSFFKLDPFENGVHFKIRANKEMILVIEDELNQLVKFKLAIGAQNNAISWLSKLTKGGETRLLNKATPEILPNGEDGTFFLSWPTTNHQLQFGTMLPNGHKISIISWPLPTEFSPSVIRVLEMADTKIDIRFWHGQEEPRSQVDGGHNRVFQVDAKEALNGTVQAKLVVSSGFNLPLVNEVGEVQTFAQLMNTLRNAATLSILERLQRKPQGSFTNNLVDKMHKITQDLMYFRNVDGSFGDAMTQQTFRQALEQLFLLTEIETFYPLTPILKSGLESWILKSHEVTDQEQNLDILEWAPLDSKVYQSLAVKAHGDSLKALLGLQEEIGPMGMTKVDSFSRTLAVLSLLNENNSKTSIKEWTQLLLVQQQQNDDLSANCEGKTLSDATYLLWTLANLQKKADDNKMDKLFNCVHSHSKQILQNSKAGYAVIRALTAAYHFQALSNADFSAERNLKISVATSQDLGHSKTWRMAESEEEMKSIQNVWKNGPQKLYFLATGTGCATVEVETSYETFSSEVEDKDPGLFDINLDSSQDSSNYFYLTICLKLKAKAGLNKVATSVNLEFFSGFKFEAISSKDFWFHASGQQQNVLLHIKEVMSDCGTCATLKFKRVEVIENLGPAILTISPNSLALKATKLFFHLKSLHYSSPELSWIEFSNDSAVVSSEELAQFCPLCSFPSQHCENDLMKSTVPNMSNESTSTITPQTQSLSGNIISTVSLKTMETTTQGAIKVATTPKTATEATVSGEKSSTNLES